MGLTIEQKIDLETKKLISSTEFRIACTVIALEGGQDRGEWDKIKDNFYYYIANKFVTFAYDKKLKRKYKKNHYDLFNPNKKDSTD